jgi:hypothetical protein
MTVLNPRPPAIQDEGLAQGFAYTLNFVGAGVVATVVAGVATITIAGGGGGAATIAAFTADCPYPTVDQVFNVIDASVTGASKVLVSTGHYTDLDTNSPEDIDWNVESVAAGSFNFRIRSKNNEVVGGPYKFFYMLG